MVPLLHNAKTDLFDKNLALKGYHRSSHQRCSIKKGVLKEFAKFTGKHLCQETLAQAFSCEFCETYRNTCFTEHLWTTASNTSSLTLSNNFILFFSNILILISSEFVLIFLINFVLIYKSVYRSPSISD